MDKYGARAATSLAGYLKESLPGYLRTTESDVGLAAGSIEDPVDVIVSNAPLDTRSPLFEIYCERSIPEDHLNGIWNCDISVAITYLGDSDIEASELKMLRYATATVDCLRGDPSLNSSVVSALVTDQNFVSFRGPEDITRKIGLLGVEVKVKE